MVGLRNRSLHCSVTDRAIVIALVDLSKVVSNTNLLQRIGLSVFQCYYSDIKNFVLRAFFHFHRRKNSQAKFYIAFRYPGLIMMYCIIVIEFKRLHTFLYNFVFNTPFIT